jgi:hypothetical protein
MPAAVTFVRATLNDSDTLNAAAFNALTAPSATVQDVVPGSAAGVMPATTTAAGLALTNAADAAAQRVVLGLAAMALQAANAVAITGGAINGTPIGGSTAAAGGFTTLSASGILTVASNVLIGSASPASDITTAQLFQGSNVARNWRLAANVAGGEFTITPSTAGGGTTYTTPVVTVTTAGAAITGALSATGAITSTVTAGLAFNASSATTGQLYQQFGSTGGTYYTGLENSAGSAFGASAYALFRYAPAGRVIQDMINGVVITSVSSTGLAVTGALSSTGILSGPGFRASKTTATSGLVKIQDEGANVYNVIGSRNNADNAALPLVFQGSNFDFAGAVAVTGTVSATGNISNTFAGNVAIGHTLQDTTTTSGSVFINFLKSSGGVIGSIARVTTTDAVVYNTTSDGRLKENFGLLTESGRLIDSLTPRTFDRKDGTDSDRKGWLGFVAQEVYAADPVFARIGFVTVGDDDPTEVKKTWGVSSSPIDAIVVAELQSLRARVAHLEAA